MHVACGSILLKIAVSELVIIKLIHKFVEDFQIASSIQSLVEENWTDYATPGDCTPRLSFPNGAELHESHEGVLLLICVYSGGSHNHLSETKVHLNTMLCPAVRRLRQRDSRTIRNMPFSSVYLTALIPVRR